jgi:hypothetical protein
MAYAPFLNQRPVRESFSYCRLAKPHVTAWVASSRAPVSALWLLVVLLHTLL